MAHHNHRSHGHGGHSHGLGALGVFIFARSKFAPLILLLIWGFLLWGH